jgi:hypothetical protein
MDTRIDGFQAAGEDKPALRITVWPKYAEHIELSLEVLYIENTA